MTFQGPSPDTVYPMIGNTNLVFLKNYVKAKNIIVGDYTYFDDFKNGPENFETHNVLYNYNQDIVRLIIGKFCALAAETKFIMTGNHKLNAISTYPFPIFKQGWEKAFDYAEFPIKGDIVVGHDVWFGYDSLILPGVTIGHGAIIGARAVVTKDIPPYAVVVGNPGRIVKMRFDERTIEKLVHIAWWDWDIATINAHLSLICSADIVKLEEVAYKTQ